MRIEIDSERDGTVQLRAAAAFCLMLAGDIPVPAVSDGETTCHVATGASLDVKFAPPAPVPVGTTAPTPLPPPPSNVLPFPPAPPVPVAPVPTATGPVANIAAASAAVSTSTNTVAPIPPTVGLASAALAPVEYDETGLPWDARIHQKGKAKKKDGTWKLQKGLDPALAQAVVQELASKRRVTGMLPELGAGYGTMPPPLPVGSGPLPVAPPPPMVPLPPAGNSVVPLPPVPPISAASVVSAQISPPPVLVSTSIPGQSAVNAPAGAVTSDAPANPYRALMDKLTQAVTDKKLDPRRIAPVVQRHGAPNFSELADPKYHGLLPGIDRDFETLIAGLPLDGIS